MRVEVKMPRMGQSMEEGTLLNWLKPAGSSVKAGEPLAEIETDKAVIEIEAFASGTLTEVLVERGQSVPVGTILGYIEDAIEEDAVESWPLPSKPVRMNASPVVKRLAQEYQLDLSSVHGTGPEGRIIKRDIESRLIQISERPIRHGRREISPVAKRLATEQSIDITGIQGTGPAGRIIKRDVEAILDTASASSIPDVSASHESHERQPVSKIKHATARLMVESKTTIPHFYVSMDVDMGQCLALRQSLKQRGHNISINQIILKAAALTLADYPNLNAEWQGDSIVVHPDINIAFAVALMENDRPTGLITPVIHHCEARSLLDMVSESNAIIERSRAGKLRANDMSGGTFTVSNLGMFGVKHFEAIVNPPQVAILAVGGIRKVPAFDAQDRVIAVQEMTITLSADHRVTDGAEVALFVRDLKAILEDGFALLID